MLAERSASTPDSLRPKTVTSPADAEASTSTATPSGTITIELADSDIRIDLRFAGGERRVAEVELEISDRDVVVALQVTRLERRVDPGADRAFEPDVHRRYRDRARGQHETDDNEAARAPSQRHPGDDRDARADRADGERDVPPDVDADRIQEGERTGSSQEDAEAGQEQ